MKSLTKSYHIFEHGQREWDSKEDRINMKVHERALYIIWLIAMKIQAWAFRRLMRKAMAKFGLSLEGLITGQGRIKNDI
jgi:hypothetical protein